MWLGTGRVTGGLQMLVGAAGGQVREYIRDAAGTSPADELAKLADLHAKGTLDATEYAKAKQQVLGS